MSTAAAESGAPAAAAAMPAAAPTPTSDSVEDRALQIGFPEKFDYAKAFQERALDIEQDTGVLSTAQRLMLYALKQQATVGKNPEAAPAFWYAEARAKWEAWEQVANMSKFEAMAYFVQSMEAMLREKELPGDWLVRELKHRDGAGAGDAVTDGTAPAAVSVEPTPAQDAAPTTPAPTAAEVPAVSAAAAADASAAAPAAPALAAEGMRPVIDAAPAGPPACPPDCQQRHFHAACVRCGSDWTQHVDHTCPDGGRGAFAVPPGEHPPPAVYRKASPARYGGGPRAASVAQSECDARSDSMSVTAAAAAARDREADYLRQIEVLKYRLNAALRDVQDRDASIRSLQSENDQLREILQTTRAQIEHQQLAHNDKAPRKLSSPVNGAGALVARDLAAAAAEAEAAAVPTAAAANGPPQPASPESPNPTHPAYHQPKKPTSWFQWLAGSEDERPIATAARV